MASDLESVQVGELDVQQDHGRTQPAARLQRGSGVTRLAHDLEPLRRQQRAGDRTERRVIVDDQDPLGHASIVAQLGPRGVRADPRFVGRLPGPEYGKNREDPSVILGSVGKPELEEDVADVRFNRLQAQLQ